MLFWLGIIFGALFAYAFVRRGFFESWAIFFNLLVGIYTAIFLRPVSESLLPAAYETPWGGSLMLLGTSLAVFLIFHCVSYTLVTGQFKVALPKIMDSLGAGALGFFGGLLVWCFLSLAVGASPLSEKDLPRRLGFTGTADQYGVSYVSRWAGVIDWFVSTRPEGDSAELVVRRLLTDTAAESQGEPQEGRVNSAQHTPPPSPPPGSPTAPK